MRTFLLLVLAMGCGGTARFPYEGVFADTMGYGCGTGSVPDVQQSVTITEIDAKALHLQSPDCSVVYVTTGSTDENGPRGAGFDFDAGTCKGLDSIAFSGLLFTTGDGGIPHMETRLGGTSDGAVCQIYLHGDKVH